MQIDVADRKPSLLDFTNGQFLFLTNLLYLQIGISLLKIIKSCLLKKFLKRYLESLKILENNNNNNNLEQNFVLKLKNCIVFYF